MNTKFKVLQMLLILLIAMTVFHCNKNNGQVAALVNDEKIYVADAETMIIRYSELSKKLDPSYIEPRGMKLESMRKQFLEGLIDRIIILDKAKELKISIDDSLLTEKVTVLKKANGIIDEISFNKYLSEQKISSEEFKKNIKEIMIMDKVQKMLFSDLKILDSELKSYFDKNMGLYAKKTVKAAHILLKTENKSTTELDKILLKAEKIVQKARKTKNFSKLAKKYSEGPLGKIGGNLGVVSKGDMVKEFDEALFRLKKGEVSAVVKTAMGYHIIKSLSDVKREVKEFESIKKNIENKLLTEKRIAGLKALRNGVKIEILWDYKTVN